MNMFLAQSYTTIAECQHIVSTKSNFTSPQDCKPMLAIKQDAMTGGFILTRKRLPIAKNVFQNILTMPFFKINDILKKTNHIRTVLELYEVIPKGDDDAFDQLYFTGHTLFSFLLPDDFEYVCDNRQAVNSDKQVLIHQGVLLYGVLNKEALGSASGSMIHHLFKDYGADRAAEFVSHYQIMINLWFQHHGFSVGLEDCIPHQCESVETVINKCFLDAGSAVQTEKNAVVLEDKICFILNQAVNQGQKLSKEALDANNSIVNIVVSGAKGNFVNVAQVTGLVGQQNVSAARIPKSYGGRTLPHFKYNDKLQDATDIKELETLFVSRGFVKSSFFKGLNLYEFFFHAAGGREGIIDTAVKTGM